MLAVDDPVNDFFISFTKQLADDPTLSGAVAQLKTDFGNLVQVKSASHFFSTLMVVSHLSIKSFDLVIALTSGGPGYSTDLPATFMYAMSFSRGQVAMANRLEVEAGGRQVDALLDLQGELTGGGVVDP